MILSLRDGDDDDDHHHDDDYIDEVHSSSLVE